MMAQFAADPTAVREFVVTAAAQGKPNLAKALQDHFGVSRPTAHNYIRTLLNDGVIVRTSPGHYSLVQTERKFAHLIEGLQEHEVWENDIQPLLSDLPPNVLEIWHYGCTEMINNAIDHSDAQGVMVVVKRTARETEVDIHDDGVGIFRKIAKSLHLEDDRHAVLELTKGKLTTDPENHTGEGIFFSSRVFDDYRILSGDVFLTHQFHDDLDWIIGDEEQPAEVEGTSVFMILSNDSERQLQGVFDEYANEERDYQFDKTVVPVKLLQYGDDRLVSRSQAKRLLARFDRFRIVVLNFEDVESIGQAFADEVFRVFASRHPEIEIVPINSNEQVTRMINRALSGKSPQGNLFNE